MKKKNKCVTEKQIRSIIGEYIALTSLAIIVLFALGVLGRFICQEIYVSGCQAASDKYSYQCRDLFNKN